MAITSAEGDQVPRTFRTAVRAREAYTNLPVTHQTRARNAQRREREQNDPKHTSAEDSVGEDAVSGIAAVAVVSEVPGILRCARKPPVSFPPVQKAAKQAVEIPGHKWQLRTRPEALQSAAV